MSIKPTWDVEWIATDNRLEEISKILEKEDILSIDTETYGWQTGNEKLCLIQIGVPSTEKIYLIDPLALSSIEPLTATLNNVKPELIAHNAPFEDRQFKRHGIKMRGAIDTLKMAKKLRSDLPSRTLKSCCKFILDIDLSKEEQSSHWEQRPLTEEQINYAALDAEVTYKLYSVLAEMEAELQVDSSLKVPELMKELYQVEKKSYELIKDYAAELEIYKLRKEMVKSTIRSKLIDGEEAYEGEYGKASIQRIKRTEINPERLRELFPEIADQAIKESVPRQRLKELMEEHNIDKSAIDEITELLRYDDRLTLSLGDY